MDSYLFTLSNKIIYECIMRTALNPIKMLSAGQKGYTFFLLLQNVSKFDANIENQLNGLLKITYTIVSYVLYTNR